MKLLIDTHALIWYLKGDAQLSDTARLAMQDAANLRYFSAASNWEIAIKVNIGKIQLDFPFSDLRTITSALGYEWLPIEFEHTVQASSLPLFHRDPFDRMLISQALVEQLTVVTKDPLFQPYSAPLLW